MSPDTAKGRRKEKELATDINAHTNDSVRCIPCGFSGNSGFDLPDLLVTTDRGNFGFEAKKSKCDTFRIESDDVDQIIRCVNSNTDAGIALRFTNREMLYLRIESWMHGDTSETPFRDMIVYLCPDAFNPRQGRTGTLIFDKPTLDEWPSKQSGKRDYQVICDAIGVQTESEAITNA